MTDAVAPAPATTTRVRLSPASLFGIAIVLGGLVIFAGNTDLKKGDNGGLVPAIVSAAIVVVAAAVLWFVVLPRVKNVNRTIVILSVLAILSLAVFWLGITPLLAAASVVVAAKAARLTKPALVLQVIAAVVAVATVVISIAQSRVF